MRRVVVVVMGLSVGLFAVSALAQPAPKTEDEKTIYALGTFVGTGIKPFNLNKNEIELFKRGISDQLTGQKLLVEPEAYQAKVQALAQSRVESASKDYLAKAEKEKGAVKTESGLIYIEDRPGTGPQPKPTDTVKVNYKGSLTDGTEFDSSYKRGQPTEFPLNGVIKCWTEGVGKMKVGGKAKLVCPAAIAYGDHPPTPKIPPKATLVFEVELLEVKGGANAPNPFVVPQGQNPFDQKK